VKSEYVILKSNIVSLEGKVSHKHWHDELLKSLDHQVRYLDDVNDKVEYPGKTINAKDKER
jgi:hypothetical protein